MSSQDSISAQRTLKPGQFFGDIVNKRESCGLVLSEFTHSHAKTLPRHCHELTFFNLILAGEYVEYFGKRSAPLKPFTTIFHPGGVEHHDEIGPHGMRIFSVEIPDAFLKRLDVKKQLTSSIDFRGSEMTWLATRLYKAYREEKTWANLAIEGLALELLAIVSRESEENYKQPPSWMPRLLELLNENFRQNLTLNAVAKELGIHPVHLSRTFRAFYHQAIGDYLHCLRIQFALRELTVKDLTLAEVAASAGFADQSHFTRVFKEFIGITPGAYRAKISGKTHSMAALAPKRLHLPRL